MKLAACLTLVIGMFGCQGSLPGAATGGQETQAPAGQSENSKRKDAEKKNRVKVRGKVVDRDAKGVANSEVIFEGPKHGNVVTDGTGSFNFEGPPGVYTIKVKSGGRETTFTKDIASGKLELIVD